MKTNIVIDTNIIFSILLNKNNNLISVLFDDNFTIFAPYFLLVEIFSKKEKLIKHSKLTNDEILEILSLILNRIAFIKDELVSTKSKQTAYDLCKDIDVKDIPFVALAFELKCKIWTGDKKLISGLKKKGFFEFI